MALYFIEEVSRRKEYPKRFVSQGIGGRYIWASKDKAIKCTPRKLMTVLEELGRGPWVFQPTLVEVDHEPT